jgi:hypothetical protein
MNDDVQEWERMSAALAEELQAAQGDAKRERAALARAVTAYGRAREALKEPPFEYVMHFFAVDGVVLDVRVKPALHRLPADDATYGRWSDTLERLPSDFEALSAIVSGA